MSATADMIIERRRIRRRLTFWRILAIVAVVVAIVALLPRSGSKPGAHIARVTVQGVILNEVKRERLIRSLAKNDDAKALIVHVNSPGGAVVPSEELYEAIREVAGSKPVVTVMSEYAASGGYITAIAGDYIIARSNTLTGSIGVYMDAPNIAGLMEIVGVDVNRVKSAPLKGEPSLSKPPSPEVLQAQQAIIDDTYGWFRDLVAERRDLSGSDLAKVVDGRAFTGRQAIELSLVDALGDEQTAKSWLIENHEIDESLAIREHSWVEPELPWPLGDISRGAAAIGQIERLIATSPRLYALIQ